MQMLICVIDLLRVDTCAYTHIRRETCLLIQVEIGNGNCKSHLG